MLSLTKSAYWKNVQPVGALTDLRKVFRDAGSNRWRIGFAAAATTLFLFWLLTHETWRAPPPRPNVVYINSWPASRTMAETKKFIAANQKQQDEIAAQQAKADEEVRQMYKALGRVSGMDVDKIERDAKAQDKAKAKAPVTSSPAPEQQVQLDKR
ncbi:MAG: hypothetical protein RLZZ136_757 [Pseudomonadota bacterium]|jgi:hypothetical protein